MIPVSRLLIVDDDESVAIGLAALLEFEGMAVEVVNRGGDAVPAIEKFAPDAVLLDITLPDMDGMAVFHQIRKVWPELPILFSTGGGSAKIAAAAISRRNVGFLQKPYPLEELLRSWPGSLSTCSTMEVILTVGSTRHPFGN